MFDCLVLSNNRPSLNAARHISKKFSSSIKTVVFFPMVYDVPSKEEYIDRLDYEPDEEGHRGPPKFAEQHLDIVYWRHCTLASDQRTFLQSGEFVAFLSVVFSNLVNARKLFFRAVTKTRWRTELRRLGISKAKSCSIVDCGVSAVKHRDFYITPQQYYVYSSNDRLNPYSIKHPLEEWWYPITIALSASSSRITEIGKATTDGFDCSLSIRAFNSASPLTKYIEERLGTLTKLWLSVYTNAACQTDQACCASNDVARALSAARNLEYLCLSSWVDIEKFTKHDDDEFMDLGSFLEGCDFPKLHSLDLDGFEASEESDLVALLQGSPHLQSLSLSSMGLRSGSWSRAVERIKTTMKLERISLGRLCVHSGPEATFWFVSPCWMVDNFFFQDGENPCTPEARERMWMSSCRQWPEPVDPMT